jgi:hypothetical protein
MGDVSAFLASLTVGRNRRAYLLTLAGEVIGHPLVKRARGEADDPMASGSLFRGSIFESRFNRT